MRIRECARLDLEPIVPVAPAQAFCQIAWCGQSSRLPLFENVAVLVQHQPRIGEEVRPAAAQVDAAAAGGRDGADMQAREQGMLEDLHVTHALAEGLLEAVGHACRQRNSASHALKV
jgi:hypothetical protein